MINSKKGLCLELLQPLVYSILWFSMQAIAHSVATKQIEKLKNRKIMVVLNLSGCGLEIKCGYNSMS